MDLFASKVTRFGDDQREAADAEFLCGRSDRYE